MLRLFLFNEGNKLRFSYNSTLTYCMGNAMCYCDLPFKNEICASSALFQSDVSVKIQPVNAFMQNTLIFIIQ